MPTIATIAPIIASPALNTLDMELLRELRAAREIAHAFLVADRPADVYQLALDRVTPLLGAAFSLVMELDSRTGLLRPVAQHEWPGRHRSWIGALRVRVGDGPSGMAVARGELVEVADVFADPALAMWYDVANELGFRSIVAAPLIGGAQPIGAIAFYYTDAVPLTDARRALVRLVADQLAATAEKATRIDASRRANAALAEANAALEREVRVADGAQQAGNRFATALVQCITQAFSRDSAAAAFTAHTAQELTALVCGGTPMDLTDIDPRQPFLEALHRWRRNMPTVSFVHAEPTVLLPTMQSDPRWMARLLSLVVGQVVQHSDGESVIHADVELGRGFIAHRLAWCGAPLPELPDPGTIPDVAGDVRYLHWEITNLDVALMAALVPRLGGRFQLDECDSDTAKQGVTLVFAVDDSANDAVSGGLR